MKTGMNSWLRKTATALVVLGAAVAAEAGTITVEGIGADSRDIGATISWSMVDVDATAGEDWQLQLCVTNDTAYDVTRASSELLTGLLFEIDGISSGVSLDSGTADRLVEIVNNTGNSNDYASTVTGASDLATEWGASMSSGVVDLDWQGAAGQQHPNYSIIGVGDANDKYTNLGPNQFPDNHEPLVYGTAYFYFSHASFTSALPDVRILRVDFNTDRDIQLVPLPPSAWMGLSLLGVLGVARIRRRRRSI